MGLVSWLKALFGGNLMARERESYEQIVNPQLITLYEEDIYYLIDTQMGIPNILQDPLELEKKPDRSYNSNETLWDAIIREQLRANITLRLNNFHLFEWFPRSPGLFHTQSAKEQREIAMDFLISHPTTPDLHNVDDAYEHFETPNFMYIFDPYGKFCMLKGGVGSIRLKDQITEHGKVWFMSASSTFTAHEGFPVALPDHYYKRYIDEIRTKGVLPCNLIGHLEFVPESLEKTYFDFPDVPQLYLLVEEIQPTRLLAAEAYPCVSVAVAFESSYEGFPKMYYSYVSFYPGIANSLKKRVEWLDNVYIKGMYKGKIEFDFDQQVRRFENATFSLDKVLNKQLIKEEIQNFFMINNMYLNSFIGHYGQYIKEVKIMGDIFQNITGSTIVNRSIVEQSFNKIKNNYDEDTAMALLRVAEEINKSGNKEAAELFETFNEELQKAEPKKSVLRSLWDGIKNILPMIGQLIDVTEKIHKLFI